MSMNSMDDLKPPGQWGLSFKQSSFTPPEYYGCEPDVSIFGRPERRVGTWNHPGVRMHLELRS
jgi:hypothetical protein